jgi:hypothetical protein
MTLLPLPLNPNSIRIRVLGVSSRNRIMIMNRSRNERGGASSCEPSLAPGVAGAPPSKRTPTRIHNHIPIHIRDIRRSLE